MIGAIRFGSSSRKMIREFVEPDGARGLDELLLAQRERLAADDPRHVGPAGDRDDEDDDAEARLDQAAEAPAPAPAPSVQAAASPVASSR